MRPAIPTKSIDSIPPCHYEGLWFVGSMAAKSELHSTWSAFVAPYRINDPSSCGIENHCFLGNSRDRAKPERRLTHRSALRLRALSSAVIAIRLGNRFRSLPNLAPLTAPALAIVGPPCACRGSRTHGRWRPSGRLVCQCGGDRAARSRWHAQGILVIDPPAGQLTTVGDFGEEHFKWNQGALAPLPTASLAQ